MSYVGTTEVEASGRLPVLNDHRCWPSEAFLQGGMLMFKSPMSVTLFGIALFALLSVSVEGATIKIDFTDLDFVYDGTDLYDAGGKVGGNGDPLEADPVTTMTFEKDGVKIGTQAAGIFADFLIKGVRNLPAGGGTVTSQGNNNTFGFDLLTNPGVPGYGLALDFDKLEVSNYGQITVVATGRITNVRAESIPFEAIEIKPGDEVTIGLISTRLTNLSNDGTFLTGFEASGPGTIAARTVAVPEPSLVPGLLWIGAIGCIMAGRLTARN